MITPAYAPTATERVLPRLALDFTTATLDPRVTVTRALNTATRFNSSGLIEIVNANLPRFDYDPVTKVCRGLLIEETRSNTVTNSGDISNASWTKSNTTIGTAVTSPDGTATGYKLVEDTATSTHFASAPATFTAGQTYAISCFAKTAGNSRRITFGGAGIGGASEYPIFDVDAGTVYTAATTTVVKSATITPVGNGWYRCAAVVTAGGTAAVQILVTTSTTNTTGAGQTYAGNGTAGVYIWGAQVELGAFATSYIPTTTTSLTRNADQVAMTGTNFSSWYNASEGTLLAEASTFSNAATDKFVANINNNGFPNRILMNFSSLNNFSASVVSNSVTQVTGTNGVAAALNTPIKMCFATKLDNFAFSQSGVAPTTDSLGAMPVTVDRLWIGSAFTTAFLNGHMRQIKYWPQRVINAEVQAFSK